MSVDIAERKFYYIGYLFRIASLVKGEKIKCFLIAIDEKFNKR